MVLRNVAPLKGGYMITSMVGFIISAIYVFPNSNTWGFTFMIFFTLSSKGINWREKMRQWKREHAESG